MQISEVTEFHTLLEQLCVVFSKRLTEDVKRVYFEALKPTPLAVIRECAQNHIANEKYFPKPFQLRPKFAADPAESRDSDSKFPPLYSPSWWEQRAMVLRRTFPKGLNQESRDRLDEATFGGEGNFEHLKQAAECYRKAWPWSVESPLLREEVGFEDELPL